ncbi:MAG: N-acetylmuramoyl-L-alanine amidase [Pseudomonadota bacterium]
MGTAQPRLAVLRVGAFVSLVAASCARLHVMNDDWVAQRPDYHRAAFLPADYFMYGRAVFQPSFVVVHVAQVSYQGCIDWFRNPRAGVSAHYVVSRTGQVTQMVKEKDTGFHIGTSLGRLAVGIEHEGFVEDPGAWFTDTMYQASADLIRDITQRWGIPRDRCHVIGHDEVPNPDAPCQFGGPERHTDPGKGWDWSKLMRLMDGSDAPCSYDCTAKTGSIVGVVRTGGLAPSAPVVPGAIVRLATQEVVTDSLGQYRFDGLALDGIYLVKVAADGFLPAAQRQAVELPVDHQNNFALVPAY